MEGYSVTEAASVLGVPTERVWELLARGVLSGVPDGETGMRVFLQPRPAPPAVEEPRRSNGGGSAREPEAEASPFRELLSEFRNLTERYGQALLALGESRGEVASLRSRVDLLEARFDLRLPMSGASTPQPSAATGWNARSPEPGPTVEPIPAEDAAGASQEHEASEPAPPRRRRRGQHRATDDFAEALARAEDPSPAELPGGEEAAAAFAALRDEAARRTAEHADAALPRELPAAEPIATIEPDEIAWAVSQPVAEAEGVVEVAPQLDAEPEAVVEEAPEPVATAEIEESVEPIAEAPAVEVAVEEPRADAPAVEAKQQPIVDELAAVAIDADAIVDSVPPPIEEAEPPPPADAGITFDGLPGESEPKQPWYEPEPAADAEPEPAAGSEPEPSADAEPSSEPAMESASAEVEAEAAVEAAPGSMAETPPAPIAEADTEPDTEPDTKPDTEPEPVDHSFEAEPEAPVEVPMEPVVEEAEPPAAVQADEVPDEPAEAEPAEGEDAPQGRPALEPEVEVERTVGAEPEGGSDAEPSWDRDRYTARIEEPDWIPEERAVRPPTTSPGTEAPSADTGDLEADGFGLEAEPTSPEPPSAAEAGRSTPTGEETMMWFGREPNRAAPAWPNEDDSAAEMEVASTGGHATRPRPVPDEPIGFRPPPAVPPADLPDIRAEYRASLRSEPPSPASRAYRRLRRIFPG